MIKRPYRMFLEDIGNSISKIEKYIGKLTYKEFLLSEQTIDAVLRNFEIIGEASKNIPAGVRNRHPEVPWKRMIGLRNIVVHEYFGVDLKIVWQIAAKNLPLVRPVIDKLLVETKEAGKDN